MRTNLLNRPVLGFLLLILFTVTACKQDGTVSSGTKDTDQTELNNRRAEIQKLADDIRCDNESDWAIAPIGSKACGGPIGYVAYSLKTNTDLFLKKIEEYTQLQKAFNVKWNQISDCSLVLPPKGVQCDQAKAKLVY